MNETHRLGTWGRAAPVRAIMLAAALVGLAGCEVDSWMDPSVLGRWERTPVTLPILDRMDVVDEQGTGLAASPVMPEDLIPVVQEYVIGPSDLVSVSIFELIVPGADAQFTRRVDETGRIRIPFVGPVQASDYTSSQLEVQISEILERKEILVGDPVVNVILLEARQRTFSIVGAPEQGSTAYGTYGIPMPNFRMLDALALARGVNGRTKTLLVFRQVLLNSELEGRPAKPRQPEALERPGADVPTPTPVDKAQLIDQILEGLEESLPGSQQEQESAPAPPAIDSGLEREAEVPVPWVNVGGKWVKVDTGIASAAATRAGEDLDEFASLITQRIIEVPYDRLINGDMRFNIVVRPGDVIRVPDRLAGFVYLMGAVNRPGAYTVPGEDELTLKQLIASGGNLNGIAIPERVDLIRRVGGKQEVTIRLNLRAIFEGHEPDFFLKPNDLINVGRNFAATPLAIFRNGFRSTYGFAFVLDRNFGFDVFRP